MSRRSAAPFAAPESAPRSPSEIILGRYPALDVAVTESRTAEPSAPALRRDDRPAGRMTLLPAG